MQGSHSKPSFAFLIADWFDFGEAVQLGRLAAPHGSWLAFLVVSRTRLFASARTMFRHFPAWPTSWFLCGYAESLLIENGYFW